ncbi:MAG: Tex-like N-terminal domain-containing protein, partial [Candidatus Margulisiibacteriota bacterium]
MKGVSFINQIIIEYLKQELKIASNQIRNVVELLQSGATIPFIARYRKEKTGELNEIQIRDIEARYNYYQTLLERKETILTTIEDQGKLTPELRVQIEKCLDKQILEDLYLPYKPRRKTKADQAIEKGLKPLAELIMAQVSINLKKSNILDLYVNPDKGINSSAEALLGAQDILAQQIADTAQSREYIREFVFRNAILLSKVIKKFADQKTKFEMYYNFSEKLAVSASHRILAIRRGEAENILKWELAVNDAELIAYLQSRFITNKAFIFHTELKMAIEDAYQRLIFPSIQTECFNQKCELAERESIDVFSLNLKNLLLSAPAGQKTIMGIDPGFRTGCKVVVIDQTGRYLTMAAIYPIEPHNKIKEAEMILLKFIETYPVSLIAIGNGTASRETMQFVRKMIQEKALKAVPVIVNESGASVYSASEYGYKEFPDLDVTVRGAISIARRLQDPLAELVKIDPKSMGVGQYQHDVNQVALKEALDFTTEYCVNYVGVDLNTASVALLTHVAGIGKVLAQNIVKFRDQNNTFSARNQL